MYVHTYICIPTYIHTYTHIHTHIHIYIHKHIRIFVYIQTYIHTHTCIHAYTCMHTYAHTHTCTYTYIHTYIHRYIWYHAYMHIRERLGMPYILTHMLCAADIHKVGMLGRYAWLHVNMDAHAWLLPIRASRMHIHVNQSTWTHGHACMHTW
jgi:hypothetical protein